MSGKTIPLNVPDIGDAEKIELVSWYAAVGEQVAEGQEICELVTDKAAVPMESPRAGKIAEIKREAGSTVVVGETLVLLEPIDP